MTTRTRSLTLIVAGSLAWAAMTACNQQTILTPIRSFDRPSDVALTCVQFRPEQEDADTLGDMATSPHGNFDVRPIGDCEPVRAASLHDDFATTFVPPIGPSGPFTPFLVALVTQSARGELALVDTTRSLLIDADPYKPGYGFIPVGQLPEHIRSTTDGCWAVTANSGSCDLSKIDVSLVMHSSLLAMFPQEIQPNNTAVVTNGVTSMPLTVPSAGGKPKTLYARPSWIEMAPANDAGGKPAIHGYEAGGTAGVCTGGDHRAWVALPGCQLVVKVHLEAPTDTPTIEAALHVDKSGVTVVSDLSTLDCPVECDGPLGTTGPVDAGPLPPPSDLGVNLPTTQAWPAALAVDVETDVKGTARAGRLIIGDGFGERIDIVPFDVVGATFGTPQSVTLDPGDNGLLQPGVRVVRAGPRSEAGKFLYAVARDGSVRVIDLDRGTECETNPDPRWNGGGINLQQTPTSTPPLAQTPIAQARQLGCFPVGDPATPRRSPLAHSPGIALAQGQLPVDVAFVHLDGPPEDPTGTSAPPAAAPGLMVGDFAWIITSDGRGTVVNIFDACPAPNQQQAGVGPGSYTPGACLPQNVAVSLIDTVQQFGHPQPQLLDRVSHRLRSGHPRFFLATNESDNVGQPRVTDSTHPCAVAVPPTSPGIPDGGVPDAGSCGSTTGSLPGLYSEPVPSDLMPAPGTNETRSIYFVDPDHVRTETWVLTWEGVLPGTSRALGFPLVTTGNADPAQNGAFLSDPGGAWCGRGVRAGDKMVFVGCSVDSECDQAAGFQCVRDPGAFIDVTQGMCLLIDKTNTPDSWSQACGKLLRSQRKFRILHARQAQTIPGGSGTSDILTVGEIYEPEFAEQTHTCTTAAGQCDDVKVVSQVGGGTVPTSCLTDADGQNRCLLPCDGKDDVCGADFECALSVFGDLRCMRAPIGTKVDPNDPSHRPILDPSYWHQCMPEAQEYEVHAGGQFTVSGTQSGYLTNEVVDASGECVLPPQTLETARLSQWRVPLSAPPCPPNVNQQPLAESIDPALQTNVCSVMTSATSVELIHFENPIFNIVAQVPKATNGRPLVPPDGTSVSINLTGGGANLVAQLGVDVQAQQPRNALVAPDGQTVYVVDEGKSPVGAGLRGQLLRLFSASQSVDTTFIVR
jgi:hypothetical protein